MTIEEKRKALATAIAKRRKDKGLTTYQLADAIGKRQPRIAELESGNGKILNIDTYLAVVQELGGEIIIKWKK